MLDVLIAAAHPSELKGLQAALGRSLSGRVRGLRVAASTIGVGVPAAAIGTIRALRDHEPRALVLLGSCGVYGRAPLLTAAVPDTMQLVDAAVIAGRAAFPDPMPISAKTHRAISTGITRFAGKGVLRGSLATTPGITTSTALANKIAKSSKCTVENLEGVAVGLACESERVPFAALLVVTNVVGKQGRKQWLANHAAAADRGSEILLQWLARGAPGLPPRVRPSHRRRSMHSAS